MKDEVRPQFVYSPEGRLEFRVAPEDIISKYTDLDSARKLNSQGLEELAEVGRVEIEERGGLSLISVNVKERMSSLGNGLSLESQTWYEEFFGRVSPLLACFPQDKVDRVVGINAIGGPVFSVNQHFQRWMNLKRALSEGLCRRVISNMQIPFGATLAGEGDKRLIHTSGDNSVGMGDLMSYSVGLNRDRFGFAKLNEQGDGYLRGEADWFWPNLSTMGNCACLGSDGLERSSLILDGGRGIYDLVPHNIDNWSQILSLILGVGTLAYEAAEYEGREDIFEEVSWVSEYA